MSTIAILGNNYQETTSFINKIIMNTKAKTDQEHIKMNIIIDNKLFEKSTEDIIDIIKKIEKIDSNFLVLTFNNQNILKIIENNIKIPILNKTFDINNQDLISKIISCKDVNS